MTQARRTSEGFLGIDKCEGAEDGLTKAKELYLIFGLTPSQTPHFIYKLDVREELVSSASAPSLELYLLSDFIFVTKDGAKHKSYPRAHETPKVTLLPGCSHGFTVGEDAYYSEPSVRHLFWKKHYSFSDDQKKKLELASMSPSSSLPAPRGSSEKIQTILPKISDQQTETKTHAPSKSFHNKPPEVEANAFISNFALARSTTKMKGQLKLKKDTYFFFLGNDALFYCSSETDDTPKGVFHLSSYDKIEIVPKKQSFTLESGEEGKTVTLSSYSMENVSTWVNAIKKQIAFISSGTNQFSFQTDSRIEQRISVKVWSGKALRNGRDTFCSLVAGGEEKARSGTIWQSTEPVFNEEFFFAVDRIDSNGLTLHIYDMRKKENHSVGLVSVPVFFEPPAFDALFQLVNDQELPTPEEEPTQESESEPKENPLASEPSEKKPSVTTSKSHRRHSKDETPGRRSSKKSNRSHAAERQAGSPETPTGSELSSPSEQSDHINERPRKSSAENLTQKTKPKFHPSPLAALPEIDLPNTAQAKHKEKTSPKLTHSPKSTSPKESHSMSSEGSLHKSTSKDTKEKHSSSAEQHSPKTSDRTTSNSPKSKPPTQSIPKSTSQDKLSHKSSQDTCKTTPTPTNPTPSGKPTQPTPNPTNQATWYPLLPGNPVPHISFTLEVNALPENKIGVILHKILGLSNNHHSIHAFTKLKMKTTASYTAETKDGTLKQAQWEFSKSTNINIELFEWDDGHKDIIGRVVIPETISSERFGTRDWPLQAHEPGHLRLEYSTTSLCITADGKYDDLFALLVADDFMLARMLSKVTSKQTGQLSGLACALIRACEKKRTAVGFVKALLHDEVQTVRSFETLFRGNTLATKSFENYMKLILIPYLHKVLKPTLFEIMNTKKKESCELDPIRLEATLKKAGKEVDPAKIESAIKKNLPVLIKYCNAVLAAIQELTLIFPMSMRVILDHIRVSVLDHFGADAKHAVHAGITAFLFLRLLIPAISQPTVFRLVTNHPTQDVARTLMLIATTILKLSNLKEFNKEPHLIILNPWINKSMKSMISFLDEMSVCPTKPVDALPTTHMDIDYGQEMAVTTEYIISNFGALEQQFQPSHPTLVKLRPVLNALIQENKTIFQKVYKPL